MTPIANAAPPPTDPIASFSPAEGRALGLPFRPAFVDGGLLSCGTGREVGAVRLEDVSGGAAGALFAGAALIAAAALLLALVVPWLFPQKRRTP